MFAVPVLVGAMMANPAIEEKLYLAALDLRNAEARKFIEESRKLNEETEERLRRSRAFREQVEEFRRQVQEMKKRLPPDKR